MHFFQSFPETCSCSHAKTIFLFSASTESSSECKMWKILKFLYLRSKTIKTHILTSDGMVLFLSIIICSSSGKHSALGCFFNFCVYRRKFVVLWNRVCCIRIWFSLFVGVSLKYFLLRNVRKAVRCDLFEKNKTRRLTVFILW